MGFFSRLFGIFKSKDVEQEEDTMSSESIIKEPLPRQPEMPEKKPPYQKVPRTVETKEYVNSIVKKASQPDLKPEPHKNNVDRKKVENYVDKIQGRR